MKLYPELPARRLARFLGDLLVVGWLAAGTWFADQVRLQVLQLQAPGQRLIEAGGQLQNTFRGAAQTAGQMPFVGGDLAGALNRGTDAGQVVADAGRTQVEAVGYAATGLNIALLVLVVLPVLVLWLPHRVRYVRAATSAAAMRRHAPELLAMRALTALPPRRLLRLGADPAAAWRRGDRDISRQLAALHLAALGLRPARRN